MLPIIHPVLAIIAGTGRGRNSNPRGRGEVGNCLVNIDGNRAGLEIKIAGTRWIRKLDCRNGASTETISDPASISRAALLNGGSL